ncbi:hypothetical protein [Streptomyces sp. NPDC005301]|uniref:hypothetical protein n=1 Tax=Streptomyces sp. NPDC005301 TaxID=3156874 RepID=UPI0033B6D8F9
MEKGLMVMALTLADPLSGVLHDLLTARSLRERNKELVLALVGAGNRGEVNELTRPWASRESSGGALLPAELVLTVESLLADTDTAVLRATARAGRSAWSLVAELRFDGAGHIVQCHDMLVPGDEIPGKRP